MSAIDVSVMDDRLIVILADSRELAAPLTWFPRLPEATQDQRKNWRLTDLDDDISVASRLRSV